MKKIKSQSDISVATVTDTLTVTTMSGFTVINGENVVFLGPANDPDCFFLWDSENCKLTINGDLEVSGDTIIKNTVKFEVDDPIMLLGGQGPKLVTEVNDFGIEFFYFNDDADTTYGAFFGYDQSKDKFIFTNNMINTGEVITGEPGNALFCNVCVKGVVNENTGVDLSITSVEGIVVTAADNISFVSTSMTTEVTDGIILSSTGTSGIDILSTTGNIDILGTNSDITLNTLNGKIRICAENDSVDICTTGAGDDITLTSTGGSIHMLSTENIINAIIINATSGGIDIDSNGDDIDITSTNASIHILSTENVQDAIVINATSGGIDVLSNGGDIDVCAIEAAVNIKSTANQADAITITSFEGGIDIIANGTTGEDIDITALGSSVHIQSTENVPDAITLTSVDGGIDIISTGDDIDVCANDGAVNIKSTENTPDAITINSSDGGLIISSSVEDIDITSNSSINLTSSENVSDAIVLNSTNGGLLLTSNGDDIDITSTNSINIASAENAPDAVTINSLNGGIDIIANGVNDDIDICGLQSAINIKSNEDSPDSITLTATDGGIDIVANGIGNDIDICALQSSINIKSSEDVPDAITITTTDGGIDIIANGQTGDDIDITALNSSINISSTENVTDAITIKALDGGMNLESVGEDIIICAVDAGLILKGDTISLVNNDGDSLLNLDILLGIISDVVKTDYRAWIPYLRFDPGINGAWITNRNIISGTNSVYYWRKSPKAETAYISCDINETIRSTTNKGFKLKKLLFSYDIEDEAITSISPTITKKTFNQSNPAAGFTITDIPFTDDNLTGATGLVIGTHYRSVSITTPEFINDESILTIELCLETLASSVFKFYGMFVQFDQNHL